MKLSPREKELLRRIGEVLHYMWDPIGVAGVPQARDEYDGYALQVFGLLKATTDAEDLADYLGRLSVEQMGVHSDPGRDSRVVEALLQWRAHLVEPTR